MRTIFTSIILAILLQNAQAQITTVCEDDFTSSGNKHLNERLVADSDLANTGFFGHSQLILNGKGSVVSSNGGGAANVPLPRLEPGSVVTLSAIVRPAGNPVTWIGIGFTQDVNTLSSFGELTLALRVDGAARLFAGPQSAGEIYYKDNEVLVPSNDGIGTLSELTLLFDSSNHRVRAQVNDRVIFDASIPEIQIDHLRYASFELASQNAAASDEPGYVDRFVVKIDSGKN